MNTTKVNPQLPCLKWVIKTPTGFCGNRSFSFLVLEKILQRNPDHRVVLQRLAWFLATSSDVLVRDGDRALMLALRAKELPEIDDFGVLETIAAAYAEVGDFNKAVDIQMEAVFTIVESKNMGGADDAKVRLDLYQSEKCFHR